MSFAFSGISHYRRDHAPHREYIDPSLSIAELFKSYAEKCKAAKRKSLSLSTFSNQVRAMNISFAKLGHEECEVCLTHEEHNCTADAIVNTCDCCSRKKSIDDIECICCQDFTRTIGNLSSNFLYSYVRIVF